MGAGFGLSADVDASDWNLDKLLGDTRSLTINFAFDFEDILEGATDGVDDGIAVLCVAMASKSIVMR